ncbi:hypothetical protein QJS66_05865 [Kocuria rhizophila]|nr:hypothetical protein QJS66_05865 [Kocuria rhizophila]
MLLCNPHDPLGLVHDREELAELAEIVERHRRHHVVSDDPRTAHAPRCHLHPYLLSIQAPPVGTVSPPKRQLNLAGLERHVRGGLRAHGPVAGHGPRRRVLPDGDHGPAGHAGGLPARRTGWTPTIEVIESSIALLERQLADKLPQVQFRQGQRHVLAWLDVRDLGWGGRPCRARGGARRGGRVIRPAFGAGGAGFARMNLASAGHDRGGGGPLARPRADDVLRTAARPGRALLAREQNAVGPWWRWPAVRRRRPRHRTAWKEPRNRPSPC